MFVLCQNINVAVNVLCLHSMIRSGKCLTSPFCTIWREEMCIYFFLRKMLGKNNNVKKKPIPKSPIKHLWDNDDVIIIIFCNRVNIYTSISMVSVLLYVEDKLVQYSFSILSLQWPSSITKNKRKWVSMFPDIGIWTPLSKIWIVKIYSWWYNLSASLKTTYILMIFRQPFLLSLVYMYVVSQALW